MPNLLGLFAAAAFSGAVVAKILEYLLVAVRRRFESRQKARAIVDEQLDPILKAADELLGKLRSLAERDFADLQKPKGNGSQTFRESIRFINVLYLFGLFWARVEILRKVGLYVNLNKDKRGKRLSEFLHCLESTRVRIQERAFQRALGELLLLDDSNQLRCMSFHAFAEACLTDDGNQVRDWFAPLKSTLEQTSHTRHRQRVLLYGAVIHAMIDTLDPRHTTTKDRPGYGNKLTRRTRRELKHRVFACYLPFVNSPERYIEG